VPGRVVPLTTSARPLGQAAAAFLAQPDLAVSTRRSYQQTLGRLERELGVDLPLATLTLDQVTVAVTGAWGGRAPATWNRHVATVRSFLGFCRRRRWLADDLTVDLERRAEPADRTKAVPLAELERLWCRGDLGVREKALWRFLYETAARATEALSINIEDLDLDNKRVRVRSKGSDTDWLPLPDRLRAAAPAADRRARGWAAVPGRPRPRSRPRASRRRPLPRHRPGPPLLPACRDAVPPGLRRVDAASAAPLGTHPPGRAEREPAAADGQEPPHQPAVVATLRPAGCRSCRGAHRGDRPRPQAPSPTSPTVSTQSTEPEQRIRIHRLPLARHGPAYDGLVAICSARRSTCVRSAGTGPARSIVCTRSSTPELRTTCVRRGSSPVA
jgi:integrase